MPGQSGGADLLPNRVRAGPQQLRWVQIPVSLSLAPGHQEHLRKDVQNIYLGNHIDCQSDLPSSRWVLCAAMSLTPAHLETWQILQPSFFIVPGHSGQGELSANNDYFVIKGDAAGQPVIKILCWELNFFIDISKLLSPSPNPNPLVPNPGKWGGH